MGSQKNCLNETVLLSTQNICLNWWVRKYFQFYAQILYLSKPMFSLSMVQLLCIQCYIYHLVFDKMLFFYQNCKIFSPPWKHFSRVPTCFCCAIRKTDWQRLLIPGYVKLFACWFFEKLTFSKNSFRNTISVSNMLDTDQSRHFVGPDLGPNCLQKVINSRQRVKIPICMFPLTNL